MTYIYSLENFDTSFIITTNNLHMNCRYTILDCLESDK